MSIRSSIIDAGNTTGFIQQRFKVCIPIPTARRELSTEIQRFWHCCTPVQHIGITNRKSVDPLGENKIFFSSIVHNQVYQMKATK